MNQNRYRSHVTNRPMYIVHAWLTIYYTVAIIKKMTNSVINRKYIVLYSDPIVIVI